jgi:hypothetical protein
MDLQEWPSVLLADAVHWAANCLVGVGLRRLIGSAAGQLSEWRFMFELFGKLFCNSVQ